MRKTAVTAVPVAPEVDAYAQLLESKRMKWQAIGIPNLMPSDLSPVLFDFQAAVTALALRRGRCAVWIDTGLGKSFCEVEWSRRVSDHCGGKPVLICEPLGAIREIVAAGKALGIPVTVCKSGAGVKPGVNVTNYQKLHLFNPSQFVGFAAGEAAILKNFDGATRQTVQEFVTRIDFRSSWTAMPAPNDLMELGTQCEFLGVMTRAEMLATFFCHDGGDTSKWRLKGHAVEKFWAWVASWAVGCKNPADLGFDGSRYVLPPLHRIAHVLPATDDEIAALGPGNLLVTEATTLSDQRKVKKLSISGRIAKLVEIVCGATYRNDTMTVCGNQNTKPIDRPSLRQSESISTVRRSTHVPPQTTPSTCANTTSEIQRSESLPKRIKSEGGKNEEISTPMTPSTEKGSKRQQRSDQSYSGESNTSEILTESHQPTMTECSNHKEEDALFAEQKSPIKATAGDSISTTATPPELSEDFSAITVITDLESSLTTPIESGSQLHTSNQAEQWLVWCSLNAEQDQLKVLLGDDAVSIDGSTPEEVREILCDQWRDGKKRIMISKPAIFGWGLNFQHCANIAYVGIDHSLESDYQSTRRCWRFGQTREVYAHYFYSEAEGPIVRNLERKEADQETQTREMLRHMQAHTDMADLAMVSSGVYDYLPTVEMVLPSWLALTVGIK